MADAGEKKIVAALEREVAEEVGKEFLAAERVSEALDFFEKARDMGPSDPKLLKRIAEGLEATK